MKKRLLIVLLLAFICIFSGCTDSGTFNAMVFETEVGEKVTSLVLDVENREIVIAVSPDERIRIEGFESSKEYYDISLSGQVLTLKGKSNKTWLDFIGTKPSAEYRKLSLMVPFDMLENISLRTSNEDIIIEGPLSVSDGMDIDCSWGNISFSGISVGKAMNLRVKNGDINGSLIGKYTDFTITRSVKKGDDNLSFIPAPSGEKELNVEANNGDVKITFSES